MSRDFWGKPPIAIAHRGGDAAGAKKENTLAAFKAAWRMGYRYGETDVILSADGQVAAIHGAVNLWDSLLRGRRSRRGLQRNSLERLRRKYTINGEEIPTLGELLKALPKMRFFIDPKTEEVVEPLAELLKKLKATDRVCVGSFNYGRIERFRKLLEETPVSTSFIIGRGFRLVNKNMNMLKTGRLSSVEAVQLHHSLVSRQMLDLVHKQGFKAVIWTCNSEIAVKNAVNCGAEGIISDRLTLLQETLAGN
jgi:glycerophosphoryl diester phosphodiesterase